MATRASPTNHLDTISPKGGASSVSGFAALRSNVEAALELADRVRSTYGPLGRDKLISISSYNRVNDCYESQITVSNDGATVLRLMKPRHPVAKLLAQLSATQDTQVGDGTTSVVLFAAYLLKRMISLVSIGYSVHLVTKGYRMALDYALDQLEILKKPLLLVREQDSKQSLNLLNRLVQVPLNSKMLRHEKEFFASLVVQAAQHVGLDKFSLQSICLLPVHGGSVQDSCILDGAVFSRSFVYAGFEQQPKRIEQPRVLLLNQEIELKHQKEYAKIIMNDPTPEQYKEFIDAEWDVFYRKLQQIVDTGCTVVLDQQGIGDLATQHFARHGITCVSRIPSDTMQMIAEDAGIMIQSSLENVSSDVLGQYDLFEQRNIGEERFCILSRDQSRTDKRSSAAVTIIVRGPSEEVLQEAVRSLNDAIAVCAKALQGDKSFLLGGGATEMELRERIDAFCQRCQQKVVDDHPFGSELYHNPKLVECMRAFGLALEDLVHCLAENCGIDGATIISKLRHVHHSKASESSGGNFGIDIEMEDVGDMEACGVLEPTSVKRHALSTATETACLIASIDYVI